MSYLDRIRACHRWTPGDYLPFLVDGVALGAVEHAFRERLTAFPEVFTVAADHVALAPALDSFDARSAALAEVTAALRAEGAFPNWRGEDYPVAVAWGRPPLFRMERAAVPRFGLPAYGVHVNGVLRGPQGLEMWIGKRARTKQTAPGKLDHITAGGQPYGLGLMENVIKECAEEAGIPADLAARAVPVGALRYRCTRAEGLRNDVAFCFDLDLPADFRPENTDGEVESFERWPVVQVLERLRETTDFKFNVALVILDFAVRHGVLLPDSEPDYQAIVEGLAGHFSE